MTPPLTPQEAARMLQAIDDYPKTPHVGRCRKYDCILCLRAYLEGVE